MSGTTYTVKIHGEVTTLTMVDSNGRRVSIDIDEAERRQLVRDLLAQEQLRPRRRRGGRR